MGVVGLELNPTDHPPARQNLVLRRRDLAKVNLNPGRISSSVLFLTYYSKFGRREISCTEFPGRGVA